MTAVCEFEARFDAVLGSGRGSDTPGGPDSARPVDELLRTVSIERRSGNNLRHYTLADIASEFHSRAAQTVAEELLDPRPRFGFCVFAGSPDDIVFRALDVAALCAQARQLVADGELEPSPLFEEQS